MKAVPVPSETLATLKSDFFKREEVHNKITEGMIETIFSALWKDRHITRVFFSIEEENKRNCPQQNNVIKKFPRVDLLSPVL